MDPSPTQSKKAFYIVFITAVVALIIGVIGLLALLSMPSKTNTSSSTSLDTAPEGALTVGNAPYLYACNVLSRDDIASTVAQLPASKVGEQASSTQAIPASQTTDKKYDLLKTQEGSRFSADSITSKCAYTLTEADARKSIEVTLTEYASGLKANEQFNAKKSYMQGSLTYKSLPLTSLIDPRNGKVEGIIPDSVDSFLAAKNVVIELRYSMGDSTPQDAPTKLDALATHIVDNVKNTDKSIKPYNFDSISTIGSTKFVDACQALDFAKLSSVYGEMVYDRSNVTSTQAYGKVDPTSTTIRSNCQASFRYQEDSSKLPDIKTQTLSQMSTRYPNRIELEIVAYTSPEAATTALAKEKQDLPKKTLLHPFDFAYGSASLGFTQDTSLLGVKSTTSQYEAVKGAYVINFSVNQGNITTPYQSTVKVLTNDQAKKVYDSFSFAK